ncbi:MAG: hypothetical protein RLP44_00365 [Aggregatilineales bacterium]
MYKVVIAVMVLVFSGIGIVAQDEAPPLTVVRCVSGEGCVRQDSPLNQEEATVVIGEEAPETDHETYVLCIDNAACGWGHLPAEEADLALGDDGIVDDLVFEEGEGETIETEDDVTFTEEEGTVVEGAANGAEEDDLTFTEEEVELFDDLICGGGECRYAPVDAQDFESLFGDVDQEGIQPLDGTWTVSIDEIVSGCPGGVPDVLTSVTRAVTFSDPFVVQDVMDLSGVQAMSVSYSNSPTTNTYIAGLEAGQGVSIQFAYRVLSEARIAGSLYLNIEVVNCAVTGSFSLIRESD